MQGGNCIHVLFSRSLLSLKGGMRWGCLLKNKIRGRINCLLYVNTSCKEQESNCSLSGVVLCPVQASVCGFQHTALPHVLIAAW